MDRAVKTLDQGTEKQIMIQRGNSWEVVLLSQIVYCEVQGRKLYIHRNDGTVLDYYDRLEAFEHRVDGRFFRCHRSYLVNLAYVRGCRDGQVLLFQGEAIPVSRLREQELTQTLLRYMKERVTDRSGCYRADCTKTWLLWVSGWTVIRKESWIWIISVRVLIASVWQDSVYCTCSFCAGLRENSGKHGTLPSSFFW